MEKKRRKLRLKPSFINTNLKEKFNLEKARIEMQQNSKISRIYDPDFSWRTFFEAKIPQSRNVLHRNKVNETPKLLERQTLVRNSLSSMLSTRSLKTTPRVGRVPMKSFNFNPIPYKDNVLTLKGFMDYAGHILKTNFR